MGLLRSGQASLAEVAKLAGVSKQLAFRWTQLDEVDWQPRRSALLDKTWKKRIEREKAAIAKLLLRSKK